MELTKGSLREFLNRKYIQIINLKGIAAAAAKSLQSCPTLCNPIDSSPLGSSVPGILQARVIRRTQMKDRAEKNLPI